VPNVDHEHGVVKLHLRSSQQATSLSTLQFSIHVILGIFRVNFSTKNPVDLVT
jgi:hypothetical protein